MYLNNKLNPIFAIFVFCLAAAVHLNCTRCQNKASYGTQMKMRRTDKSKINRTRPAIFNFAQEKIV